MRFLHRLRDDLRAGIATLRYGTVRAANRALEEAERLQTRLELRTLDAQLNEICRDIGERALQLYERGEPPNDILDDPEILKAVERARDVKLQRNKLLEDEEV